MITSNDLAILDSEEAWRIEATGHVDDPDYARESTEFREHTDKLVTWCDERGIDPTPIWEVYCQIRAVRYPSGWTGPWRSPAFMEETMRKAIFVCKRIQDAAFRDQPRRRWTEPMTLTALAKLLNIQPRTVKSCYGHAIDQSSRQSWRIDFDAVRPKDRKNIKFN